MPHPSQTLARTWIARLLAAATVVYAMILVYATHYPKPDELLHGLLGKRTPSDKTLHFIAYAVLGGLASATWLARRRANNRDIVTLGLALAAFGAVDEVTQPLFRRHADPLDWIYDCIGVAIGIAAVTSVVALGRRFARTQ